jgi:Beta-galactosidase
MDGPISEQLNLSADIGMMESDMTLIQSRRQLLGSGTLALGAAMLPSRLLAQNIDSSPYRVVTGIDVALPYLGSVKSRSTAEINGSNWLLGCETLDRDFADWDAYKEYIAPLGIKQLRMQGGWAKTEKVKGQYDFAWLDHIINDAHARGFQPWLQTSYGNSIYSGGGGTNLSAGFPTSPEALTAYDRWVAAMVTRYKDKVIDWEVWNEPNFGDNIINTPEMTAELNIRTAEIIKRIQPSARISGLALGHYNERWVKRFFAVLGAKRKFGLFHNMSYHDYVYNPDANRLEVAMLRAELDKYAPGMPLRQGENGAPSGGGSGRGALWDYPWSELTQAKWNLRRMLGNLGQDIESSIFGLAEMAYTNGPINRLNFKGLLKSDMTKRISRPKTAYYAIQNLTAIFDDRLERIMDLQELHTIAAAGPKDHAFRHSTDRDLAFFGYRHKVTGKQAYTIWQRENIPVDANQLSLQEITLTNADFDAPVWIDLITGAVHEVPAAQWRREGVVSNFGGIPVYDSPIVLADKSLVGISA